MKLYALIFAETRNGCQTTSFYLAKDDLDFLKQIREARLSDVENPEPPDRDARHLDWVNYHEEKATFHTFMAHALSNEEFHPEVTDRKGEWQSRELTEEDLATLRRLGVFPERDREDTGSMSESRSDQVSLENALR